MNKIFKWIKESLLNILLKKTQDANEKKSPEKNRDRPPVIFNGNINGPIIFIENVHIEHGELSLITAYRKNEARQDSTGSKNPGTYIQNGLPPTSHQI